MGPNVSWYPCNILSTQDYTSAGMAKAGTLTVFTWKGDSEPECWWRTEEMMTVPGPYGCDMLVDDGGDATQGNEFEEKYAKEGSQPDPTRTDNAEFRCTLQVLKDFVLADKIKHARMAKACHGAGEKTTTVVHRL